MTKEKLLIYAKAFRVNQWIKNLVVFTAIIFSGTLFDFDLFKNSLYAFFVFCLLSSTSYLLNDIIDYHYDRRHPVKKNRPIASGKITIAHATFLVFILTLTSLIISLFFSVAFFFLSLVFILLHFFYSLYLKKYPVIDIFTISFSFMIRTFAGEIVTGYHIPSWLLLTIFFISLFMATVKRQAEFLRQGQETRESLYRYKAHFLDFLTYTFASATFIAYATYTYVEKPPQTVTLLSENIHRMMPNFEAKRWFMVTIPLVVYAIARYAQLFYEKAEGERPENIITSDRPLIVAIFVWGAIVIGLIYVF